MAQTNNSFLADKVALRAYHLPDGEELNILDCYAGKGLIWEAVKKLTGRKINVLSIERGDYEEDWLYLPGDNLSYLRYMDLSKFDVIDLDAYGIPFLQLEEVFGQNFDGVVFVTFIQSLMGGVPYKLLETVGFNREMIETCPTVFFKNGWAYFLDYLYLRGVRSIWHRSHDRKHYLGFRTTVLPPSNFDNQRGGMFANLS